MELESLVDDWAWILLGVRTFLSFVVVLFVLRWFFRQPENLPPGPWMLPLVGCLPALAWGLKRGLQPHHVFAKYAERYGTVFRVGLFNKTVVVLNDFASTKAAFQHPQLNERPFGMGKGVTGSSGELWMKMRHFSLSTLRGLGVGKSIFEEQIGTEAEELIKAMAAFNGKPFNPKPHLAGAVSNVICSVTFGQRYQYDDQDFQRLLALESSLVLNLGIGGFFFFFGDVGARLPFLRSELQRLETDHNQILAFIKSVIDLHRSKFDSYNLNDFVDAYLMEIKRCAPKGASSTEHDVSVDESSNTRLNNKNLLYVVDDLFSAGSETTVTTLEWCLLHMAIYPEVQQRVQAEIDAVVGRNRRPRLADKPGLNLTRAVIWEVQRMASIVPLGLPHVAAADTQLNGFLIPKGTFIVSNLWRIFRDPTLWPEPESFKPERFLNAEGEAVKPEEFIPFGVGRRICLGQHLAEMELFVFFSYFMHKFTFMKSADAPPLTLEGKSSVTFSPLPFEICAVERN